MAASSNDLPNLLVDIITSNTDNSPNFSVTNYSIATDTSSDALVDATESISISHCATTRESSIAKDELRTFTCFPKLPFDLRTEIFKIVCFEPRIINIWPIEFDVGIKELEPWLTKRGRGDEVHARPYAYHSHALNVPAILHASSESRTIARKFYSLAFGTSFDRKIGLVHIKITTPARIYVNWKCDIICPMTYDYTDGISRFHYGQSYLLHDFVKQSGESCRKMRRLAVEDYNAMYPVIQAISTFDLEEIIYFHNFNPWVRQIYGEKAAYHKMPSFKIGRITPRISDFEPEDKPESKFTMDSKGLRPTANGVQKGIEEMLEDMRKTEEHTSKILWPECRRVPPGWKVPDFRLMELDVFLGGKKVDNSLARNRHKAGKAFAFQFNDMT